MWGGFCFPFAAGFRRSRAGRCTAAVRSVQTCPAPRPQARDGPQQQDSAHRGGKLPHASWAAAQPSPGGALPGNVGRVADAEPGLISHPNSHLSLGQPWSTSPSSSSSSPSSSSAEPTVSMAGGTLCRGRCNELRPVSAPGVGAGLASSWRVPREKAFHTTPGASAWLRVGFGFSFLMRTSEKTACRGGKSRLSACRL